MTFKQRARTQFHPYPPKSIDDLYAFAVEIIEYGPDARMIYVRCPFCGHKHGHAQVGRQSAGCDDWPLDETYVVAVPAGTSIMVNV